MGPYLPASSPVTASYSIGSADGARFLARALGTTDAHLQSPGQLHHYCCVISRWSLNSPCDGEPTSLCIDKKTRPEYSRQRLSLPR